MFKNSLGRSLIIFLTILVMLSACRSDLPKVELKAKQPAVEMPLQTASFLKDFESAILENIARSNAPGAMLAVAIDSNIFSKGYGYANKGTKKKNDEYTLFRLGSLSKGFSATLASILAENNQLDFDESVQQIIPAFKLKDSLQTSRITIKHLLSHSTGLPRHAYTNLVEDGISIDRIIPELASLDLIAREDSLYAYQNAAFGIIEPIFKQKTNSSYSKLLKEKICKPAGMHRTSVDYKKFQRDKNKAYPHLYASEAKGFVRSKLNNKYQKLPSAGGVFSSAKDMSIWLSILLGNHPEIITSEGLDRIFEPVVPTRSNKYYDRWSDKPAYYAMGWRVIEMENTTLYHHTGFVNNYRSEIAIDRKNKLGICVIYNAFVPEAREVVPLFLSKYHEHFRPDRNIISLAD